MGARGERWWCVGAEGDTGGVSEVIMVLCDTAIYLFPEYVPQSLVPVLHEW